MGMSGVFEVGIEEGATIVRIGTALFAFLAFHPVSGERHFLRVPLGLKVDYADTLSTLRSQSCSLD